MVTAYSSVLMPYWRRKAGASASVPWSPSDPAGLLGYWRADAGAATGLAAEFVAANSESLSRSSIPLLNMGDTSFSIAVWVRMVTNDTCSVLAKMSAVSGDYSYGIQYLNATNRFRTWISSDGSSGTFAALVADTLGAVSIGQWYMLLVTYNASTDAWTISGNAGARNTGSYAGGAYAGTASFRLGAFDGGSYLTGCLGPVGIWKGRVLSTDDEAWLYNGGQGRMYADLPGEMLDSMAEWWDLTEESGDRMGAFNGTRLTDNNTVTSQSGIGATVCGNGDPCVVWRPTAGSVNLKQLTYAKCPTFTSGVFGTMPGLLFATDDWLGADALAATFTGADKPMSVVALVKQTDGATNYGYVGLSRATSSTPYRMGYSNGAQLVAYNRDDASSGKSVNGPLHNTDAHVFAWRFGAGAGYTVDMYKSGVTPVNGDVDVGALTLDEFSVGIGRRAAGALYPLSGNIGALLVYDNALSDANMAAAIRFLGELGGVTIS